LSCRGEIKFEQTFDHTHRALKAMINTSVLNRVKYLDGSSLDHHCTVHRWNNRFWIRSKNIGWILKYILLRTDLSRTSCIAKSRLISYFPIALDYLECEANTIQRIYWSSFSWIGKWPVANVWAITAISRDGTLVEGPVEYFCHCLKLVVSSWVYHSFNSLKLKLIFNKFSNF